MRVFLDTSVIVAAVLEQHADHRRAFTILQRVQNGKDEGVISAHSLAEMYATLTRIPLPFRHSPEQALLSIEENILKYFTVSGLSVSDYSSLLREAAAARVQGGTVYDALLLKSAAKKSIGKIYTLNLKHFEAIAPPELAKIISAP